MCPRTVFLVIVSHVDTGASCVGNIIAVGTSAIPLALSLRSQLLQLLNSMVEDSRLQQFPAIATTSAWRDRHTHWAVYEADAVPGQNSVWRSRGSVAWLGGVATH